MKKHSLPFFIFATLLILTIPLSIGGVYMYFATMADPGWHATFFPPFFFIDLLVSLTMLFVIIAYWKMWKRDRKVNWTVFFLHFALTIPVVLDIAFPTFYNNLTNRNDESMNLPLLATIISAPYVLFTIGQALFLVYFSRSNKAKTVTT